LMLSDMTTRRKRSAKMQACSQSGEASLLKYLWVMKPEVMKRREMKIKEMKRRKMKTKVMKIKEMKRKVKMSKPKNSFKENAMHSSQRRLRRTSWMRNSKNIKKNLQNFMTRSIKQKRLFIS